MKPVLTAAEYRRVDQAWEGDLIEAMDRAGHAVALAAAQRGARYGKRVVVLAGPGNNGGDGYVAARYLRQRGVDVEVQALTAPKTIEAMDAEQKALAADVPIGTLREPGSFDLIVDALFGGGVRRGLPDGVVAWMDPELPVVAVDFPTGLDPDTGIVQDRAFRAVETVAFGTIKTGHVRKDGPEHCGRVTVADIGIEGGKPSMFIAEEIDAPRPLRPRAIHKWSAGSVLVVGGSVGMVGAAVHAGRSALTFGAGSVGVVSPRIDLVQMTAPEILAYEPDEAKEVLDRFDVVIFGPGLAESDIASIDWILRRANRVVLDAGGLTPELVKEARKGDGGVVVTPHAAEFQRLSGVGGGSYSTRALARSAGVTVLLKGNPTTVSDGGPPVLVDTGGPELASIGTGDVLAGMIGALWARGLTGFEAAVSGAYWHGVAAGELHRHRTVTAEALSDYIAAYAW